MLQLSPLVPGLTTTQSRLGMLHELWWVVLAVVVFVLVMPLAYMLGSHGGRPGT
jgi:hypothetical protein